MLEQSIELLISDGVVKRCVPITRSGEEFRETYERQLEYIRAHADRLGMSASLVEALQTQFCPQREGDDHIPKHRQELGLCDSLGSCIQHPMRCNP